MRLSISLYIEELNVTDNLIFFIRFSVRISVFSVSTYRSIFYIRAISPLYKIKPQFSSLFCLLTFACGTFLHVKFFYLLAGEIANLSYVLQIFGNSCEGLSST